MLSGEKDTVHKVIKEFVNFQELQINAKAELDILIAYNAKNNKLGKRKNVALSNELKLRIINQQIYIDRIKDIVKQWSEALLMLAQTYDDKECEMFLTLIVKNIPPEETKWKKTECDEFIKQVKQQIKSLKENGGV